LLSLRPDDRPQRGQEVVAALNEITRYYAIDVSGHGIASFLAKLFPGEGGTTADKAPVPEARARGESRSPISPSASGSMSSPGGRSGQVPIDQSVAITPRSNDASVSVQTPAPAAARSGATSVPIRTPRREPAQWPAAAPLQRSRFRTPTTLSVMI